MVKYEDDQDALNRTFAALADPTRRALLARLAQQQALSVSVLAQPFAISLPAVMKHLDVLAEAGLVTREKTGRTVECRLAAGPMEEAMLWLAHYERFWSAALDRLAAFVEEDACQPNPTPQATAQPTQPLPATAAEQAPLPVPTAPASSSGAVSTRAPRRSTRHGRKPRN